jgi:hypothetical protein
MLRRAFSRWLHANRDGTDSDLSSGFLGRLDLIFVNGTSASFLLQPGIAEVALYGDAGSGPTNLSICGTNAVLWSAMARVAESATVRSHRRPLKTPVENDQLPQGFKRLQPVIFKFKKDNN